MRAPAQELGSSYELKIARLRRNSCVSAVPDAEQNSAFQCGATAR